LGPKKGIKLFIFPEELGRMLAKKEKLENLASRPFVALCATFASRKR
jgi:hypothetical protein